MELIQKLETIFTNAEIVKLKTNRQHSFSINWLKATKQRPYHILFTAGLADKPQNTSEKYPEFKHIELYICLPDYWKIEKKEEEHSWPIEWLDRIASAQQSSESWFGPGDTLPAGKPPKAFSPKMEQNHFILAEPMKITDLKEVVLTENITRFLAIIPIYQRELETKLSGSAKHFMAKYQLLKHTELVDNFRLPIVKKMNFKKIGWYIILTLSILGSILIIASIFGFNLFMIDANY
jgi:hypothetical protein